MYNLSDGEEEDNDFGILGLGSISGGDDFEDDLPFDDDGGDDDEEGKKKSMHGLCCVHLLHFLAHAIIWKYSLFLCFFQRNQPS